MLLGFLGLYDIEVQSLIFRTGSEISQDKASNLKDLDIEEREVAQSNECQSVAKTALSRAAPTKK